MGWHLVEKPMSKECRQEEESVGDEVKNIKNGTDRDGLMFISTGYSSREHGFHS